MLDLYQRASDVGMLAVNYPFGDKRQGIAWQVSGSAASGLAGDRDRARRLVGRALKHASTTMNDGFVDHDGGEPVNRMAIGMSGSKSVSKAQRKLVDAGAKPSPLKKVLAPATDPMLARQLGTPTMLALLREFLPSPNPVQVIVALLIARSIGESITDLGHLRDVLMRRNPVVLLRIPVAGFERQCGLMLEDALLCPFYGELTDIRGDRPLSERFGEARPEMRQRKIVTASGRNVTELTGQTLTTKLSKAILGDPAPVVIADETSAPARPEIIAAADIVLQGTCIDPELIAELLYVCLGVPVDESSAIMKGMVFDPIRLGVDDLALAVRPGRTARSVLSLFGEPRRRCGR